MCDHSNVRCRISVSPGEMEVSLHCLDCGLLPSIEAMSALAQMVEGLVQILVEGRVEMNQDAIKATLN